MRSIGTIAALAALFASTAAAAQSANEAFECNLPYRATLEAIKNLTVLSENKYPSADGFGPSTVLKFGVGPTRIYGERPSSLAFVLREPAEGAREQLHAISFTSTFLRARERDTALRESNDWRPDTCGPKIADICIRAKTRDDLGELSYVRDIPLSFYTKLNCTFELSAEDIGK